MILWPESKLSWRLLACVTWLKRREAWFVRRFRTSLLHRCLTLCCCLGIDVFSVDRMISSGRVEVWWLCSFILYCERSSFMSCKCTALAFHFAAEECVSKLLKSFFILFRSSSKGKFLIVQHILTWQISYHDYEFCIGVCVLTVYNRINEVRSSLMTNS